MSEMAPYLYEERQHDYCIALKSLNVQSTHVLMVIRERS